MFERCTLQGTREIDEYCDLFEANFGTSSHVPLCEAIVSWRADNRRELLAALLPLELELRARSNDWPNEAEYRKEFEAFEPQVTEAFQELRAWASKAGRAPAKDTSGSDTAKETPDTRPVSGSIASSGRAVERPEIPRRIGRYVIERELGAGGMGRVFLAHDEVLNRQVAVKLPHFNLGKDTRAIERFFREAQSMASLRHPNICPVYDVGEDDGYHFLTMAFIDGKTLAEQREDSPTMSGSAVAELLLPIARAIQFSHDAGVLHRDLKPSNVLIDQNGEPFVTDFGLALNERGEETNLTQTGAIIGSPAYMAPEQVNGDREKIGPACDVYALGVMLYEMLCGQRPFQGNSLEILGQITSGRAPQPPSAHRQVDSELERICLKAMAHRMEDRYDSACELANELKDYLATRSAFSVSAVAQANQGGSSSSARKYLAVTAAALILVALGVSHLLPTDKNQVPTRTAKGLTVHPAPAIYGLADRYLFEGSPQYRGALGGAVAMDGDTAVVGARDSFADQLPTGQVFLFEKEKTGDTASWRQSEVLLPSGESATGELFGHAVAIAGDRIAVAAPQRNHGRTGSVYIFGKSDAGWELDQRFEPPEGTLIFGMDVAVSESDAFVLAKASDGRDVVHVFRRDDGATWSLGQTLDPGPNAIGFVDLDLANGELVASRATRVSGEVREVNLELVFFHIVEGHWEETNALAAVSGYFGKHCLDRQGDQVVLGLANSLQGCGSVRYYRKDARGNWKLEQTLEADQPTVGAKFGARVAIGRNRILVGSEFYVPKGEVPTQDSVSVFRHAPDGWQLERSWTKEDQLGHRLVASSLAVGPDGECLIGSASSDGGTGQVHSIDRLGEENRWIVSTPDRPISPFNTLFGQGIAVTENDIAISAKFFQNSGLKRSGQIQVLSRETKDRVKLFAGQPVEDGVFGELVLMEGNTLVGGSRGEFQIFENVKGQWTAGQAFAVEGELEHHFGPSGCLSGDWLAISVRPRARGLSDPLAGTEYDYIDLYRRSDGGWSYAQRLQAQDSVPADRFGCSISIQGDLLAVGAFGASPNGKESGAAYLFRLVGNRWQQQQKLTASNGAVGARFGSQVDLDGSMLAVSADREATFGKHSGAVYLFRREGDTWSQLPEVVYPLASSPGSNFGASVDLDGNRLLVGAREEGRLETGIALLFYYDGQRWIQHQKLMPSVTSYKQHFGSKVIIAGDSLVIAADGENDAAGAVYVFEPEDEDKASSVLVSGKAE